MIVEELRRLQAQSSSRGRHILWSSFAARSCIGEGHAGFDATTMDGLWLCDEPHAAHARPSLVAAGEGRVDRIVKRWPWLAAVVPVVDTFVIAGPLLRRICAVESLRWVAL